MDRARHGLAGGALVLTAAVALIGGCGSTTDGKPTASPGAGTGPTEPTFPKSRPGTKAPTPTSSARAVPAPPPSPTKPKGAVDLPANDKGYVFIETKSGQTRCQISSRSVGCEADFTNSPMKDGEHANGINITADGTVEWILGNLGDIPTVTIDYRTYDAQGWTIVSTVEGTRFTNDSTRHGMFVSIAKVETF